MHDMENFTIIIPILSVFYTFATLDIGMLL